MFLKNDLELRALCWTLALIPVVSAGIACLSNPCLHGICIDDLNSTYMCYCIDGYTGVHCQTNWDECWSGPCQHGGTCLDGIASYNCTCPEGFIGDNCETNFNECESNPCLNNGTCIDMTNEYVCHCMPGFSGDHCEVDAAVCDGDEVRCHNGGQCVEGPGYKFYCRCSPGWAGKFCEDQIDECESNPCQNGGMCIDIHADYMCACAYGFTGKSCEVQIEFCDDNSCSNDALCVVEDDVRVCYCVPDYHGERCELQYDECLLGPRCMNGGTCIDGVDNFTCSCPPNLTGTLCECLIINEDHIDCEYVSPTTLYNITASVHTTNTENITTEVISTVPTTINNTSNDLTSQSEPWTTTIVDFTSSTEAISQTIGEKTSRQETTTLSYSNTSEIEETTTSTTEVFTLVPQTQKTISSEDFKTESTCKDTCDKVPEHTLTTFTELETTLFNNQTSIAVTYPTKVTTESQNQTTTEITTLTSTESTTKITIEDITIPTTISNKIDTTEKMFTDVPTEYSSTDASAYTTESVETTTLFDNTTHVYTTVQSECTDSICNNHGSCANTIHGIRCHCLFNYGGRFCEEKLRITTAAFGGNSYIVHRLINTTSISIEFSAKTLITDGHIMHVDIASGAYMELFLNSGLLKFKFSCGYQTMLLSELKTYVNKGYQMKIETRLDLYLNQQQCNATLHLNDTVAMSGGQIANISIVDHDIMLYFGIVPDSNYTNNKPFIGCIKDLKVNNKSREIFGEAFNAGEVTECSSLSCLSGPCLNGGTCNDQGDGYSCSCANGWMGENCKESICEHNPCESGGSCVRYPGSGFLCLCPYGKHGIFCEYNVEITRPSLAPIAPGVSSYLVYPLSAAALSSERFELRLRFQTADMDQIALLAFVGQSGRHGPRSQHLALTFVKGYLMLTWNMGNGPRRVFTSRAVGVRRGGHAVRVWRRGRSAGISVDGRHNVSGNAPAPPQHDKMTLLPYLYIGGHPSFNFAELPHDLPLHSGWRGCVWDVSGQAPGGRAAAGRGVGQCGVAQCTASSCNAPRGLCIHSPATYGCICNEGWFGPTCASAQPACGPRSRCRGNCVLSGDGRAHCDCPYGMTGENCEHDVIPIDVMFSGVRSYLRLLPRSISSVSLSLEAEIKPDKERGLLILVQTPHFYTALSLQGGLLEYRWTDRLSGLTSLVRSGVVAALRRWQRVRAGRYAARLYVWLDGALSTEPMLAHAYPHTASDADILIGGAQDLSTVPFDAMSGPPESYSGCIRHLHVNNVPLPLDQQNIRDGRNVGACGGAACEGGRCRRAACDPARCRAPHGHCRRSRCVCAAGRAGEHCQTHINITIPQFGGDSLLSLPRRQLRPREQRLAAVATHLALNFTTSEPSGLLLWIDMGIDYLGIGMENGYIKLVWSLHCDVTEVVKQDEKSLPIRPRRLSRILPNVGFLADGEWHKIVLEFGKKNITLTVDKHLAFIEESCERDQTNNVDLFIGGVNEEDNPAVKTIFPQNFKGCIDQISTREDSFITNYSEFYSENVNSCQLFPTN
ncbi:Protein eyes shut [Papilio xuthus]|uniref:Protein eyes shut n=1 Tax=Papilio xuthus TaxID=66420 RepID=A0A194PKV1_PAPXU|nr:Protein eyes shut [Papilio xuthus]